MSESLVRYRVAERIALVEMDDGKANVLSEPMVEGLFEAFARAEKEAAAVVLTGRPDRFCAGFDLKALMSSPTAARSLVRRGAELWAYVYGFPLPVVIACTGHAVAGGATMLLTGDVRVGTAGAYRIGLNEVQIGMPVPIVAIELARDRLKSTELTRATLHAAIYRPDEAVEVGFLDVAVSAADVEARAKAQAIRLMALSSSAFRNTKKRLRKETIAHMLSTLDEDLESLTASE